MKHYWYLMLELPLNCTDGDLRALTVAEYYAYAIAVKVVQRNEQGRLIE